MKVKYVLRGIPLLIIVTCISCNFSFSQHPIPRGTTRTPGWVFHAGGVVIGDSLVPGQLLRIHRSSGFPSASLIHITNSVSGSGNQDGLIAGLFGNDAYFVHRENGRLLLGTGNNPFLCLDPAGQIGISMQSPQSKMHLHLQSNRGIQISNNFTDSLITSGMLIGLNEKDVFFNQQENASLSLMTSGIDRLKIDGNGNIGIGVNPSEKFDIDGNIRIRPNALSGYILTSDQNGVGTWQPLPSYSGGNGISVSGNEIINTLPDQEISISGSGSTTVTGAYPTFTISSTDNNTTYQAGNGLALAGNTFNSVWTRSGNNIYKNNPGNVGIGAQSPEKDLHIKNVIPTIRLQSFQPFSQSSTFGLKENINSSWDIMVKDGNLSFHTTDISGSVIPKFVIMPNGKTGIGIGEASATLDINGNMRVRNIQSMGSPPFLLVSDANGFVGKKLISSLADNLGNHTATKNIALGIYKITRNGGNNDAGMSVDPDGNIGIGTFSYFVPRRKIHIHGDYTSPPAIRLECPVSFMGQAIIYAWDIVQSGPVLQFQYGNSSPFGTNPNNSIQNMSSKMVIDGQGNLGIGIDNIPTARLQVNGNVKLMDLSGTDTRIVTVSEEGILAAGPGIIDLNHWTREENDLYRMEGNVGIGTQNPAAKLHVEGISVLNGNVGVGTTNPMANLHVQGNQYLSGNFTLGCMSQNAKLTISSSTNTGVFLETNHGSGYGYGIICRVGSVDQTNNGENTKAIAVQKGSTENFIVFGNGHVWARKIRVKGTVNWSDYVFEDDYNLMSLTELEKFVNLHKHLPGIPDQEEVAANGIDLAEMNALLLKKIEELTLYVLELKTAIEN